MRVCDRPDGRPGLLDTPAETRVHGHFSVDGDQRTLDAVAVLLGHRDPEIHGTWVLQLQGDVPHWTRLCRQARRRGQGLG